MADNIAVLAYNGVDSDEEFIQYMKNHEGENSYFVYEFESDTIEDMVEEISDNCQDVMLVYDAEEGITPNFDGFVRELHHYEIDPIIVVLVHDDYYISREEAETLIPDAVSIEDPEYDFDGFVPRVVFFDKDIGFSTEPDFENIININFLLN